MTTQARPGNDLAHLFASMNANEAGALAALDWTETPAPGDTVCATFSPASSLLTMRGSAPFLSMLKENISAEESEWRYLKSDALGQFLVCNRSLLRAYIHEARAAGYPIVGDYTPARLFQVTSELAGMEAANLAILLATLDVGVKTILIDADPKNQFLFPLLPFDEMPPVLTENLEKPSTFRADLARCIRNPDKNISYLNLQATSLRPFNDDEIARIMCHLDAEYEQIIVYSGRLNSNWLTTNALANFAVTDSGYNNELGSLIRHSAGCHTILMQKARDTFFPGLTAEFSRKRTIADWEQIRIQLKTLTDFCRKILTSTRLAIGSAEKLPRQLNCFTGVGLYARYAGVEAGDADAKINAMQKKLRPLFPTSTFFSKRSIYRNLASMPIQPVTTMLEVGINPQLVSLVRSAEMRALAIFPAGILPAVSKGGVRVSACSAKGLMRFKTLASRGGLTQMTTAAPVKLRRPDALAAILEQVQA
jgi:hypothetical protein